MVSLDIKYFGPTHHRPSRLRVQRNDKPHQLMFFSLTDRSTNDNGVAMIVREYCKAKGFRNWGKFVLGGTETGWVAVFVANDATSASNSYSTEDVD